MTIDLKKLKEKIEVEKKEQFETYFSLLTEYNQKFNLTAILDRESVFLKHFLDSSTAIDLIPQNSKCIEIGSGGGFPSLVLKILRDDLSFTLVESVGKKCEFLKIVVDNLSLKNVVVYNERAEILAKQDIHREKYDLSTARAVARLNTLSEYLLPFVKVGGKMIAYKGETEEVEEGRRAIEILGGKLSEVVPYSLGEGAEKRNLIVVDKVRETPIKYPRGNGKERSKPL